MKKEFEYIALKVQQREGVKPFYLLSSPASQIVKWADVPRKKAEYMVGYQRELDTKRFSHIKDFIEQDTNNIMPGSILISIKEDNINIEPIDEDNSLYKLTIKIDDETDLMGIIYTELYNRLDDTEKNYVNNINIKDLNEENEENEENEDEVLEIDNYYKPESYLATLVAELKNFDSLEEKRQKEIKEYISSISKPALILDGQHRVYGAKNANTEFNLPIVILPGMSSREQVFHFYVINNKAIPIKPTELRAVVSTSLSSKEITSLYKRFKLAGVLTDEAQWTHQINTDIESPFKNLINFGLEQDKGIIPENVMYQVVKKFIKPASKYKNNFNLSEKWRNDSGSYSYRLSMFYLFWNTISELYPNAWHEALEINNKQLLMKVTMLSLQELHFDKIDSLIPFLNNKGLPLPLSDNHEFVEQIKFNFEFLPEDFFVKEWTEKSLDTPKGRELLKEQIEKAITNKGKNLGRMILFKVKK